MTVFMMTLSSFMAFAQVPNDNIANRIELMPDAAPLYSRTHKATVEWSCLNKALTKSCLVYHNDQWFYFKPTHSARQYLNITGQQCKNFKGVQVVVLEGNPCKTETYRLLHCTSFTDQNDTFIALDSLMPGKEYLVLIDGFLGDQCDLSIQFSSFPVGLDHQRKSFDALSLVASQEVHTVTLNWKAGEQLLNELSHFEILRQQTTEPRAIVLDTVALMTNTLGKHYENYSYKDSLLKSGRYVYRIIGVHREGSNRLLLDDMIISFNDSKFEIPRQVIEFPVNFSIPGEVELVIADALTGRTLYGLTIPGGQNTMVPVDVSSYVARGIRFFRIRAVHVKSGNSKSHTYTLTDDGIWVRAIK